MYFVIASRPGGPYAFIGLCRPCAQVVKIRSGIAHRVVGVQMGDEQGLQIRGSESLDAFVVRGGSAPDDSRSGVNQVRGAVDHNSRGRSGTLRIRPWCSISTTSRSSTAPTSKTPAETLERESRLNLWVLRRINRVIDADKRQSPSLRIDGKGAGNQEHAVEQTGAQSGRLRHC